MAENKVLIAVAVIGVVGTIGAAVIANVDKLFPKASSPAIPRPTPQPRPATPDQDATKNATKRQPPSVQPGGRFTGSMGPLEEGVSYNQGDLYDQPSSSPQQCALFCYNDDRCVAITFIKSQQRCWIKSSIGPVGRSGDMVSSRKVAQ